MASTSSDNCYVDKKLYPHLFLIPAILILSLLAFLNKRKSFRKDIWGGRPGLVIPLDFLGIDHDRLTIAVIFAVSTGAILTVITGTLTVQYDVSKWAKGFVTAAYAIEIAVLFYPFFACLKTEHKLLGSIMGLLYTLVWFVMDMFATFDKCVNASLLVPVILTQIPIIAGYFFILGKFLIVLYKEVKKRHSWTPKNGHVGATSKLDLTKPWLIQHIKDMLKPRPYEPEKAWIRYLRLIYNPEKNFRFSTQTVSIVVVCSIVLYALTVELIHAGRYLIVQEGYFLSKSLELRSCNTNLMNAFGRSIVASTVLVAVVCVLSIVRFMECHKNNLLRMFKGDTSFIPRGLERSQLMVGRCLKYTGFHIGYFVWGCLLLLVTGVVFIFVLAFIFHCKLGTKLFNRIAVTAVFIRKMAHPVRLLHERSLFCLTLPLWVFQYISSMTIFRDESYKKDVIAIDNRNVYLVLSYFFVFLGLPMGFFSAILRVLKAILVGLFMLPRVDKCIMMDGFQRFDRGFASYICYLHVQAAHRNPVLRVFCQIVHDEMCKTRELSQDGSLQRATKKYRNKWLLLVTLLRNPQLQRFRKHVIAPPVIRFINDVDVSLEMPMSKGKI